MIVRPVSTVCQPSRALRMATWVDLHGLKSTHGCSWWTLRPVLVVHAIFACKPTNHLDCNVVQIFRNLQRFPSAQHALVYIHLAVPPV